METYSELMNLSKKYNIPLQDVISISLNRYGIEMEYPDNRIRFKLRLNISKEDYYFAVCINTGESPFRISKNGELKYNDEIIGKVFDIEKDTCDSTYFRRNKTALTLNSNQRSSCTGCKFCGTYNIDINDVSNLTESKNLSLYIKELMIKYNLKDLSHILRVTICTGCFINEEEVVNHLIMVNDTLKKFGFNKTIRYIGSQIKTRKSLDYLAEKLQNFSLSFTTEIFSNRDKLMREEKSKISIEKTCELLNYAVLKGFSANIMYIAGLDPLEIMEENFKIIESNINRFPVIQILQNFYKEQENYRIEEAKKIEYFLKVRKLVEKVFSVKGLKPRSWENYRGLFYTTFNDEPYHCIRI